MLRGGEGGSEVAHRKVEEGAEFGVLVVEPLLVGGDGVVQKKWPTATPTLITVASQDLSIATTITFDNPPVNIDASFADGSGLYRLEIVDAQGFHLKTLYNKPSGFEKEIWITWDGTNDQGQLLRYGNYYALFTKDGVLIQKIALIWIRPGVTGNPGD